MSSVDDRPNAGDHVADIPNDQAPLDPDFQPEDVRLIGDIESLRAISDPTRLRILETMVQRQDPAWSVKELAAEIGVPQTRLYHHVELLLERDLIRAGRAPHRVRDHRDPVPRRGHVVPARPPAPGRRLRGPAPGPPRHPRDGVRHGTQRDRGGHPQRRHRHRRGRPGRAARRPVARPRPALPRPGRRAARAHQGARGRVRRGRPTPAPRRTASCSRSTRCRGPTRPPAAATDEPKPTRWSDR